MNAIQEWYMSSHWRSRHQVAEAIGISDQTLLRAERWLEGDEGGRPLAVKFASQLERLSYARFPVEMWGHKPPEDLPRSIRSRREQMFDSECAAERRSLLRAPTTYRNK